jgi:hypothetical protein
MALLNDPRGLVHGVHSWEETDPATAPVRAEGPLIGSTVLFRAHGSVTVDVAEQIGHAAPYPDLVTNDYVRRFTVHAEAKQDSGDVDASVTIAIDLTAEQTAADVAQKQQNTFCL